jgi:hypothetical protein
MIVASVTISHQSFLLFNIELLIFISYYQFPSPWEGSGMGFLANFKKTSFILVTLN